MNGIITALIVVAVGIGLGLLAAIALGLSSVETYDDFYDREDES